MNKSIKSVPIFTRTKKRLK